jgi:hypothetical protein
MPGINDRTPSPAGRAPASRVGERLERLADEQGDTEVSDDDADRLDAEARRQAEEMGWDQQQTARERGRP